jgi:predicted kinase
MLLAITGLPGTGKSTFAKALAEQLQALHLNTDIIRDALNLRGQYDASAKEKIYDEMQRRTAAALSEGGTVIVDGTFYKQAFRTQFGALAEQHHHTVQWIEIRAKEAVIRQRVVKKRQYSEADFEVYLQIKAKFEPLQQPHLTLWSDQMSVDDMVRHTLEHIS